MFEKKFVRVESLALGRAFELVKEGGIEGAYLSFSSLLSEEGLVQYLADCDDELNDGRDDARRLESVSLSVDEVGEILNSGETISDSWLTRQYQFIFNDNTHKATAVVSIIISKASSKRDWEIDAETLFKTSGPNHTYGLNDTVIYRDWRGPYGRYPYPLREIRNPQLVK